MQYATLSFFLATFLQSLQAVPTAKSRTTAFANTTFSFTAFSFTAFTFTISRCFGRLSFTTSLTLSS
jgi:hypothetical protein